MKLAVIGVGLMFVAVMSAFVISVIWTKVSPRAQLIMSKTRGHVRTDPQLGRLIRNVKAEIWEAGFRVDNILAALKGLSIPLLVFFRDGAEAGRLVGAVPKPQIEAAIQRYLG